MQQKSYKIYQITEPDDIRHIYIGFTTQDIGQRLRDHISHAQDKNFYLANWIKKLQREGKRPKISLVKMTDKDHWKEDEIAEIKRVRNEQVLTGVKVLNILDGGDGQIGRVWTAEQRKQMSERRKGIPWSDGHRKTMEEYYEKNSGHNLGKKASSETIEKKRLSHLGNTSALGHVLSQESKLEISKSKTKWKNKNAIRNMLDKGYSEAQIIKELNVSRWAVYSAKYNKTLS